MMKKIRCVLIFLSLIFCFHERITGFIESFKDSVHSAIDDHWYGARVLTLDLSREFNLLANSSMESLRVEIDGKIRFAAVKSYRMHFGNLESVAEWTIREQQAAMRRVTEVLEDVELSIYLNDTIMAGVAGSMYNNYNAEILPRTWALVSIVMRSRKARMLDTMERAADAVRKEMRNQNNVFFETFNYPRYGGEKRSYRERAMEFATEMVGLLSVVGGISLFQ
jgi:hypothetical protein